MNQVLDDLKVGKFVRTQVSGEEGKKLKLDQENYMNQGKLVCVEDYIKFTNVPLITPTGDVFVK